MHGVQNAIELGVSNMILETDSVMVKQAATSTTYDLSRLGTLASELRSLLQLNFGQVIVSCIPRTGNKAAHALAALGNETTLEADPIMDDLPLCIQDIVASDLGSVE